MSQAHKGSKLIIQDAVYAVPFNSALFDCKENAIGVHYGNLIHPNTGSIYTMRPSDGKFGGAIAVEEGTTNLASSDNLTYSYASGNVTSSVQTDGYFGGWNKVTINTVNTTNSLLCQTAVTTIPNGNTDPYTFSIEFFCPKGNIVPRIDGTSGYGDCTNLYGNYWSLTKTGTTPANHNQAFYFKRTDANVAAGDVFYWRNRQVEKKLFPTSYVSGTRAVGSLKYPTALFNPRSFTINLWIRFSVMNSSYNSIFECNTSSTNRFLWMLEISTLNKVLKSWANNGSASATSTTTFTPNVGEWYMLTITYDGAAYRQYVNGSLIMTTVSANAPDPLGAEVVIGGNNHARANALFSEVLILPNPSTEEEILSWYIANKPFYNPYDYRGYAY